MIFGSSWSFFRQHFETGISEVEEELDEMEGLAIQKNEQAKRMYLEKMAKEFLDKSLFT